MKCLYVVFEIAGPCFYCLLASMLVCRRSRDARAIYQFACVVRSVCSRDPSTSSASWRVLRAGASKRTAAPSRCRWTQEGVQPWRDSAAAREGAREGACDGGDDGGSCRCKSSPCPGDLCSAHANMGCTRTARTSLSR